MKKTSVKKPYANLKYTKKVKPLMAKTIRSLNKLFYFDFLLFLFSIAQKGSIIGLFGLTLSACLSFNTPKTSTTSAVKAASEKNNSELETKLSELSLTFQSKEILGSVNEDLSILPTGLESVNISDCTITPDLPDGLHLNNKDCKITGTPSTTSTQKTYEMEVTSGNLKSKSSFTLTIGAGTPILNYSDISGTFGSSLTPLSPSQISNGATLTQCSASLPTGLSIALDTSLNTCVISGTPTQVVLGPTGTSYTISAFSGNKVTQTSVKIIISPLTPSISYATTTHTFTAGSAITTLTPTLDNGSGGTTVTTCTSNPTLPSGLSLNGTTCAVSGTPSSPLSSTSYTITATNSGGLSTNATLNITVNASSFTVTPSSTNTTLSPSTAQTVSPNSTQAFSATAASGYETSSTVGGSCPAGSWSGTTYTTGPITANCTVSFTSSLIPNVTVVVGQGGGVGSVDSTVPDQARFNYPSKMTINGNDLYIVDGSNYTIRKIDLTTNAVTTFAGKAGSNGFQDGGLGVAEFHSPMGLVSDGTYLYVSDSHVIRKVDLSTKVVSPFIGTYGTWGHLDGTGVNVKLSSPQSMVILGSYMYLADGPLIRRITLSTGVVTTLAGVYGTYTSADGTGTGATFDSIQSITTDGTDLFVLEETTIRKYVIATGVVTTLAGVAGSNSQVDATGTSARFSANNGQLIYRSGSLYLAQPTYSRVRQINLSTLAVTTVTGTASQWIYADGTFTNASFHGPSGIATINDTMYVSDTENSVIRKLDLTASTVSTYAGRPGTSGSTNSTGTLSLLSSPVGIVSDGTNLFIGDTSNNQIRQVVLSSGVTTTFAGQLNWGTTDGIGTNAQFNNPSYMASNNSYLFVTDGYTRIRRINLSTAEVEAFVGVRADYATTDDIGTSARFMGFGGLALNGNELYVTEPSTHVIRKVDLSTRQVTTIAGTLNNTGSTNNTGLGASFNQPRGLATDGTYLYIADKENRVIRKMHLTTLAVSTLCGGTGISAHTDGTATNARFRAPNALTLSGSFLYVSDGDDSNSSNVIRKVNLSTGEVSTLTGDPTQTGTSTLTRSNSTYQSIASMVVVGTDLFVVQTNNHSVLKIPLSP